MSSDYTSEIPLRRCKDCGREFPHTLEYFPRNGKGYIENQCKECRAKYKREYAQANKERIYEQRRGFRQANGERIADYKRRHYEANRGEILKRQYEYRQGKREQNAEYSLRWYYANKTKARETRRKYYYANHERLKEQKRQYAKNNPEQFRITRNRREARKRELPDTFSEKEWLACLEYHNFCCAVCGNQMRDLFGNVEPHADHWIPLSYKGADNPGTVVGNMICLCSDCNLSKHNKLPMEWLTGKYGKRKAVEILVRIQAYFEQVKSE